MTNRIASLDGLRGIAVALVFASHCQVPLTQSGGLGVDVFFVLSGFLITGILLDKPIDLARFYLRRVRRLTPPLLIALALAAAFGAPLVDVTTAAAYLTDYARGLGWLDHSGLTHTWSLSVEEHFYLVWPFAVLALRRLPRKLWLPTLAVAYVLATGWRDLSAMTWGYDVYYRFDTRLSGLVLGGLLTVLMRSDVRREAWTFSVLGFGIAVSAVCTLLGPSDLRGLMLGVSVAEAVTVLTILQANVPGLAQRLLSARWLVWLGQVSYGLYIYHYPITVAMEDTGWAWWQMLVVALPLSLAMAAVSFYVVERPLLVTRVKEQRA